MSQVLLNSTIISELKTLPSISKNILHRMEELGTFLPTGSKDFGPIYQLRNKSVYQGRLKVRTPLFRINYSMDLEDSCYLMAL